MTFLTWASAPSGSVLRPSLRPSACFSVSERTSKLTLTAVTPSSSRTAWATPVWKWLRIGQPAVVSETITSTTPLGWMSIERTISSSTMSRRSSGSMTERSASRTWSRVGMRPLWQTSCGSRAALAAVGCGATDGFDRWLVSIRARDARWSLNRCVKDRRGATCVAPRRLREERYYVRRRGYEAGEPFPTAALSVAGRGKGVSRRRETALRRRASGLVRSRRWTASPGPCAPSGPRAQSADGSA